MKVRTAVIAIAVAVMSVFPFSGTAYATHSCGFEPCPHVEDICYIPAVRKLLPQFCW